MRLKPRIVNTQTGLLWGSWSHSWSQANPGPHSPLGQLSPWSLLSPGVTLGLFLLCLINSRTRARTGCSSRVPAWTLGNPVHPSWSPEPHTAPLPRGTETQAVRCEAALLGLWLVPRIDQSETHEGQGLAQPERCPADIVPPTTLPRGLGPQRL